MTEAKTADWREARRLRACALKKEGWLQKDIAKALGVSEGAVSQWIKRAEEGGEEALRHKRPPGRPPGLTPEQKSELPDLLLAGAEMFGFRGDVWTQKRVAEVVEEAFGIKYHFSRMSSLLAECGWTVQKPTRRAIQRNEQAIEGWRQEKWPAIKKKRCDSGKPSSS